MRPTSAVIHMCKASNARNKTTYIIRFICCICSFSDSILLSPLIIKDQLLGMNVFLGGQPHLLCNYCSQKWIWVLISVSMSLKSLHKVIKYIIILQFEFPCLINCIFLLPSLLIDWSWMECLNGGNLRCNALFFSSLSDPSVPAFCGHISCNSNASLTK